MNTTYEILYPQSHAPTTTKPNISTFGSIVINCGTVVLYQVGYTASLAIREGERQIRIEEHSTTTRTSAISTYYPGDHNKIIVVLAYTHTFIRTTNETTTYYQQQLLSLQRQTTTDNDGAVHDVSGRIQLGGATIGNDGATTPRQEDVSCCGWYFSPTNHMRFCHHYYDFK